MTMKNSARHNASLFLAGGNVAERINHAPRDPDVVRAPARRS